ncbi:MAG: type 1 glutamine amidotransferase domain-containing protein [Candidatus Wallbacteria bacterium]|nr:type 1 glutamine amidotransferase domain-containing protein [Candidatus Wallbacteria bacterium]
MQKIIFPLLFLILISLLQVDAAELTTELSSISSETTSSGEISTGTVISNDSGEVLKKSAEVPRGRVLMVVSNVRVMPIPTVEVGIWAEEFMIPFLVFKFCSLKIDIASPTGGSFIFDKLSLDPKIVSSDSAKTANEFLLAHKEMMDKTLALSELNPDDYDLLFVSGGHSVMFDLATNEALQKIATRFFEKKKVVAAVAQGSVFLAGLKDKNGKSLIRGYRVTGFSDKEAELIQILKAYPFSLEQALRKAGAKYECGQPWENFVITDRNLITGQNPGSTQDTARQACQALKKGESVK